MNKNLGIIGCLVLVFIASVGYSIYLYQQTRTLNADKKTLSNQVMALAEEKVQLAGQIAPLTAQIQEADVKVKEYLATQGRQCEGSFVECLNAAIASQKQTCPGTVKNGACILSNFRLISPNGGEQLCLGEEYEIKWKNPTDMKFVNVFIREGNTTRKIGTYPANFNETGEKGYGSAIWKANTKEGYIYEVIVNSDYNARLVSDTSDDVFSIVNCQG